MCEYHVLPLLGRQAHSFRAIKTEEHQPCRGAAALRAQTLASPASAKGKSNFCPLRRQTSQAGRRWANPCAKYQPVLSLRLLIAHMWTWQALLMSSLSLDFCSRNRSFKGGEGGLFDEWICVYTNYCNFDFQEIWKNRGGSFYFICRR